MTKMSKMTPSVIPSYITHVVPYGIRPGNIRFVDDVVIDCRLNGLYKSLLRKDYERVKFNIIDMIDHLRKAPYVDMDINLYKKIVEEFLHMRIEMSLGQYHQVHNRIRDIHFMISKSYIMMR